MPRTTVAYAFEWRMLEGAVGLAVRHGGGDMSVLLVDLTTGRVEVGVDRPDEMRERPHLFYDPFDPPEYRWLAWHGLSRAAAETLLGVRFEPGDFVSVRDQKTIEFPESWGVMF